MVLGRYERCFCYSSWELNYVLCELLSSVYTSNGGVLDSAIGFLVWSSFQNHPNNQYF